MATNPRHLTKSRYKLALECPTKLNYTKKPDEYADGSIDDPFMAALARGGFQVGELAKCYHPEGIEISTLDVEDAVRQTGELLQRDQVTIFEAAVRHENLLVRIDILKKSGNHFELIEVKSKSCDPGEFKDEIWSVQKLKKNIYSLKSTWAPYLYDVAFQAYVLKSHLPDAEVSSFLMMADKSQTATVDGLNQKFLLKESEGRTQVEIVGDVSPEALGVKILTQLNVTDIVQVIHDEKEMSEKPDGRGFKEGIQFYSDHYQRDIRIPPTVGAQCKGCEFRCSDEGLKSGFNECWEQALKLKSQDLDQPFVFDIWNFRQSQNLIESNIIFMNQVGPEDFKSLDGEHPKGGLTQSQRQWLQVQKHKEGDPTPYIDRDGLQAEMVGFQYPLHFIDFETCMVAIPFHKGRKPYEQIAFQFSHHMVHADGRIEHAGQFIHTKRGEFPNFHFVRALRLQLQNDQGTIFRYSHHENSVLCQIHAQLAESSEPDKDELMEFIEGITTKNSGEITWRGERSMVDLCDLVQRYFYHPATGGSNSIKYVLPAVLNESNYLKKKYSQPIYGKGCEIPSMNLDPTAWIELDQDQRVKDPYKQLPPVFRGLGGNDLDRLMPDGEINNGGAAMTAYAYLQFVQMQEDERQSITDALLRYCELDTLAMVMIWEYWAQEIKVAAGGEQRLIATGTSK